MGFVNYELKRRGAKELKAASSAKVEAKSSKLMPMEWRPSGSFTEYAALGNKELPEILMQWNKRQSEFVVQRYPSDKEVANLA